MIGTICLKFSRVKISFPTCFDQVLYTYFKGSKGISIKNNF